MRLENQNQSVPKTLKRAQARAIAAPRYFTGLACKRGHIEQRYTVNGRCVECQRKAANPGAARRTVARKQAQELGLARYNSGRLCKHGHAAERFTCDGYCVECCRIRARRFGSKWDRKNPDRVRAYQTQYRATHQRRLALAAHRRYLAQDEKRRAKAQVNYQENKSRAANWCRQRKAREKGACGSHTAQDVATLLKLQGQRCANCLRSLDGGYHVDHIVPLVVGGANDRYNLQLLCPSCNCSKRACEPIEWAQRNGRLL
jgi:hypothetical protein